MKSLPPLLLLLMSSLCAGQYRFGDIVDPVVRFGDIEPDRIYLADQIVWEPLTGGPVVEFFEDDFTSDPAANGWVSNTGSFVWDSGNNEFDISGNGSHVNTNFVMGSQRQWVCVEFASTSSSNDTYHGSLLRAENNSTTPRNTLRVELKDGNYKFRGLTAGNSGGGGNTATFSGSLPRVYAWTIDGAGVDAVCRGYDLGAVWPSIDGTTAALNIVTQLETANGGVADFTLALESGQSIATGNLLGLYGGGSATVRVNRVMGGTWDTPPSRFDFTESIVLNTGNAGGSIVADLDSDGDDEFVVQRDGHVLDWNGTTLVNTDLGLDSGKADRWFGDGEVIEGNLIITNTTNTGNTGSLRIIEYPGTIGGSWTESTEYSWSGGGLADGSDGQKIRHAEEAVGDLDNDGDVDLVVRGTRYGTWAFLNDGAGGFAAPTYLRHEPREGLAVGDIDGDGRDDIIVNGQWFESVIGGTFLEHDINGATAWMAPDFGTVSHENFAAKVRVADMNGDSRLDVIISGSERLSTATDTKPDGIRLYLNPTDPVLDTWTEVIVEALDQQWHTLKIADFDLDGDLDILAGLGAVGEGSDVGGVYIYPGNGDGTFDSREQVSTALCYQGEVGDVDGDGDIDIILPEDFDDPIVRFLLNNTN